MMCQLEVLTCAEVAEADRLAAAAGTSGTVLMDRAGRAVADVAERMLAGGLKTGRDRTILVLCGPGNNGGDGFVAAAELARRGHSVEVAALSPRAWMKGDAAGAAAAWHGPVADAAAVRPGRHGLVVDALFGAGLSRPLDGAAAALVGQIAGLGCPVLSVDLPSGLSGDSGEALGPAVRATETVTFFRLKPGHLLMPGRQHCGRVTLADIGIDPAVLAAIGPRLFQDLPELWSGFFPHPAADGHKYSRGHLLVISGPMPTLGASRLAARGGLRIGAGLATLASPPDAVAAHAAHLTSVMLKPFLGVRASGSFEGLADVLSDARKNAVVIGPGLGHGPDASVLVEAVLAPGAGRRAAVLDADALTLFGGRSDDLRALVRGASGPVVLTPHGGEFARLFAGADDVLGASSKVERARAGARRTGAVLVLKGPDTVVASPDGRAAVAGQDAPWLATAGSGDVLAGMIGGLLAQDMPAFEAAAAAVWMHAAAARQLGPGLISEDLPDALPAVLRALLATMTSEDPD